METIAVLEVVIQTTAQMENFNFSFSITQLLNGIPWFIVGALILAFFYYQGGDKAGGTAPVRKPEPKPEPVQEVHHNPEPIPEPKPEPEPEPEPVSDIPGQSSESGTTDTN